MKQNKLNYKLLVIGILFLFVGMSIIPTIGGGMKNQDNTSGVLALTNKNHLHLDDEIYYSFFRGFFNDFSHVIQSDKVSSFLKFLRY